MFCQSKCRFLFNVIKLAGRLEKNVNRRWLHVCSNKNNLKKLTRSLWKTCKQYVQRRLHKEKILHTSSKTRRRRRRSKKQTKKKKKKKKKKKEKEEEVS